ncbi:MAG: hypothetical protein R2941_23290 [Desulfobacterales bacterium]
MKFAISQLLTLIRSSTRKTNTRLLLRFFLLLTLFLQHLFHVLMLYGRRSGIHGLPVFTGRSQSCQPWDSGHIFYHGDLGKLFSIIVLLSGIVFLMVMLPLHLHTVFLCWLEKTEPGAAYVLFRTLCRITIILTRHGDVTRT